MRADSKHSKAETNRAADNRAFSNNTENVLRVTCITRAGTSTNCI